MGNLVLPIHLFPKLHVFGLWEEAGAPGENPRKHGENMQTPHRKALVLAPAPPGDSNREPSYCEAQVLTTAPPCAQAKHLHGNSKHGREALLPLMKP